MWYQTLLQILITGPFIISLPVFLYGFIYLFIDLQYGATICGGVLLLYALMYGVFIAFEKYNKPNSPINNKQAWIYWDETLLSDEPTNIVAYT